MSCGDPPRGLADAAPFGLGEAGLCSSMPPASPVYTPSLAGVVAFDASDPWMTWRVGAVVALLLAGLAAWRRRQRAASIVAALPAAPLNGTTAVVTGASSGLGEVIAAELARRGATVVLACRNEKRGAAAAARIAQSVPGVRSDQLVVERVDLADLGSVRAFAERFVPVSDSAVRRRARRAAGDGGEGAARPIHLLVHNAGLLDFGEGRTRPVLTEDGYEQHFQVDFLAPYLLTRLLQPALEAASDKGSRVVFVSSDQHEKGAINFDDLQGLGGGDAAYGGMFAAYANAKAMLTCAAAEFARQFAADKSSSHISAVAANPGFSATSFARDAPQWMQLLLSPAWLLANTAEEGAATVLLAALDKAASRAGAGDGGFIYYEKHAVGRATDAVTSSDVGRRLREHCDGLLGL